MKKKINKQKDWNKIESRLQVADIILVREKRMWSKIIQKAENSYWSHVLLVFFVPDKNMIFKNILVIGAQPHGIEVHRIQEFTNKIGNGYDIGIKRVPGLSKDLREKVLSYMLNNIDIKYDYRALFGFFVNYIISVLTMQDLNKNLKQFLINKDAFICSSFLQKAFYNAMPEKRKKNVLFSEEDSNFFMEETTPADIARSKNCKWLYNSHR